MANLSKTVLFVSSVILLGLVVFPGFAQVGPIIRNNCGFLGMNCTGAETFGGTVQPYVVGVINVVILLMSTVAVIFIVISGIQYITSTGDQEKADRAKRQLLFAILGLIIALSAFVIELAVRTVNPALITALVSPYVNMVLSLVGLAAAIYIVYAGFKYINSKGDEESAAAAKRQITYALLGVFVAGAAQIIVNVILIRDASALATDIRDVVNAVLTILGLIAAAYIILGGVMYISSQGDQDKSARARSQIIYALIGLVVIIFSGVLVNFIISAI